MLFCFSCSYLFIYLYSVVMGLSNAIRMAWVVWRGAGWKSPLRDKESALKTLMRVQVRSEQSCDLTSAELLDSSPFSIFFGNNA